MTATLAISKESEAYAKGRRGFNAHIDITEWTDGVIHVCGELDHITQKQIERWARKTYPDLHLKVANFGSGYVGVKLFPSRTAMFTDVDIF